MINETLLDTDELIQAMMQHLTLGVGKNLRAMLLLGSAMDEEGFVSQDAVIAGAAVEILHLATLVHDDIIDEADIRRGQASLQKKFGKKEAVICGDYLFCIAIAMVSEISNHYPEKLKEFTHAMTKICLGELRQFKHNSDTDLSVINYLKIIAGKTSALFSLAMYSGAIINGSSDKEARFMGRIGHNMGLAFQILDDCADYESDVEVTKKSVKHDLAEEVITLPLIFAFLKKPELKHQIQKQQLTVAEINEIIAEVVNVGGVSMAHDVAEKYYRKAKKMIDTLPNKHQRLLIGEILGRIWKVEN
ncbi:polyprenyl synthetase family protein [Acetobacterium sp.]|uniref:polyprenyl synthetase family protein n=1 Tax=Acetobacterium sp. TaxID=1872094 RepID=UPI0027287328|nr:polyprenyl synthetase family protein [Acetobacterium sp.]MDO9493895.1 polyprenyl synthetase family protein [Acetobacterium sp.]